MINYIKRLIYKLFPNYYLNKRVKDCIALIKRELPLKRYYHFRTAFHDNKHNVNIDKFPIDKDLVIEFTKQRVNNGSVIYNIVIEDDRKELFYDKVWFGRNVNRNFDREYIIEQINTIEQYFSINKSVVNPIGVLLAEINHIKKYGRRIFNCNVIYDKYESTKLHYGTGNIIQYPFIVDISNEDEYSLSELEELRKYCSDNISNKDLINELYKECEEFKTRPCSLICDNVGKNYFINFDKLVKVIPSIGENMLNYYDLLIENKNFFKK